jgi:hypothetical protein
LIDVSGLRVRNLLVTGGSRRERLLDEITHLAWHRISFAEDGPTKVRETGEVLWKDVLPIPDQELDGLKLRAKFADTRKMLIPRKDGTPHYIRRPGASTGGRDPYSLLVLADGSIDQLVEIGQVSPHAANANRYALGVAVAGDFRTHAPTEAQWSTCVALAALFGAWDLESIGHTELPDSTADKDKVCPGSKFSVSELRSVARTSPLAQLTPDEAEAVLTRIGIVF